MMRAAAALLLLVAGCDALGGIEAPVLRADDGGVVMPEGDSSDAGIRADGDADAGVPLGDASFEAEAETAADGGFDSAACTDLWMMCISVCEPNYGPAACQCIPTCACLEAVHDFGALCLSASSQFTAWNCTDMPSGAVVACIFGDGGVDQ